MAVEIPLSVEETNYSIDVSLENEFYTLSFYWNVRAEQWYMSIARSSDEAVIKTGIRCAVSVAPLFGIVGAVRPAGELFFLDTSEKDQDPGRYELGGRVKLLYFTAAEVAAL